LFDDLFMRYERDCWRLILSHVYVLISDSVSSFGHPFVAAGPRNMELHLGVY